MLIGRAPKKRDALTAQKNFTDMGILQKIETLSKISLAKNRAYEFFCGVFFQNLRKMMQKIRDAIRRTCGVELKENFVKYARNV